MSLQTRLSALITAIKSAFDTLDGRVTTLEGAGGGSSSKQLFQVSDHVGDLHVGRTLTTIEPVLFGPTPDVIGSDFTYDSLTGEVTIGAGLDGKWAMVSAAVGTDYANRSEIKLLLQRWEGSAWADNLVTANYANRDSTQDEGTGVISGRLIELNTDDKWRVMHAIEVDSITPAAKFDNSTFLSIVEVG